MAQGNSTDKRRSGQTTAESVEVWTDEAYARATGLVQILDERGQADETRLPDLSTEALVRMFEGMVLSRMLDEQLLPMQRQGRISHYFEARGQEAGPIAGAHAILKTDYFVQGLREGAAAVYRGLPLAKYLAQILGTTHDAGRGRQMPCHVGSAEVRHVSTSSSVASQIPHAVGIAWAAKIRKDSTVALCFFGDGATSEDDFHAGLNFAAVYKVPVVLVCQNNQWAISTPVAAQTQSETLAIKGLAYAVPSLRVDGNDVLAMYSAIKAAVDKARAGGGPSFIEAVTYRLGAHSSADDPAHYRDASLNAAWQERDPLLRFATWLEQRKILSSEAQAAMRGRLGEAIRAAILSEEAAGPPPLASMFEDVFARPTWLLEEQQAGLTGKVPSKGL
jgi:pyruvate dehydrogenase E1 component alpha subunit/2-oxoisovalerate dehydrogenase E1 component alpha subunit